MGEARERQSAATLSLAYNAGATAAKLVAAILTGSVSLLSEAIHSATDVVASGFAYLSVRAANEPPDEDHPYGHGKMESVASFGESILLLGTVVFILMEAFHRLGQPSEVQRLDVGLWVIGLSSLSSFLVARHVSKVGIRTGSLALRSNGQHLMVDFWTSVAVFGALGVTHWTKWQSADAVFAFGFATWIAMGGVKMLRESYDQLVDRVLPAEEMMAIEAILNEEKECLSWHRLRARHSGSMHNVDVHVVVPRDWSVVQAHDLADRLEKRIEDRLAPAKAIIHVDPFDPQKIASSTE